MNTENFDKLPEEKRLSIINAGLSCFSKSGYKKTAISEIAEVAGISKAAVFHYFGTKKDLYLYLYDYAYDEVHAGQTGGTVDFFECMEIEIQNRMRLDEKYPGIYEFLNLLAERKDYLDIEGFCEIHDKKIAQSPLFNKVDWSRFQDGYDRDTIMNLATWVSMGCLVQFEHLKANGEIYSQLRHYLSIVKKALYKPEYLR